MAKRKAKTTTKRSSTTQSRPQPAAMTSFSQLIVATITFWLGNTIVLLVANSFFPRLVVLGTHIVSPFMGALSAGAIIALFGVGVIPLIENIATMRRIKLTDMHWMGIYLVLNVLALWIVSRFAEMVGMGIQAWWVAIVLGVAFDMVQGILMKQVVSNS